MTFDHRLGGTMHSEYGASFSAQRFLPMHTRAVVEGQERETEYPAPGNSFRSSVRE
ncbi:MAG: hypothetical protein ACLTZY_14170 [Alistipes indistinctus]